MSGVCHRNHGHVGGVNFAFPPRDTSQKLWHHLSLGAFDAGSLLGGDPLVRLFAYFVCVTIFLAQQTIAPERKVERNAVLSARDPNVRVSISAVAQLCRANRWNLYDIADCELHAFVDSDAQKNVQGLYWCSSKAISRASSTSRTNTTPLGTPLSAASTSMLIPGFVRKTSKHNKAPTASTLKS